MARPPLPEGWKRRTPGVYDCLAEQLTIMERFRGHWILYHRGKPTGLSFKSLGDALEHAQDARFAG